MNSSDGHPCRSADLGPAAAGGRRALRSELRAFTWSRCLNRTVPIALLVFTAPMLSGQDYGIEKPPPVPEVATPLTPEEQTALAAVDVRIAGVETLAAKIDDPAYKSSTLASIVDLKRRRASLGKKFDPSLYESLMHSVISRYQIVALWLRPPLLPAPAAKPPAAATPIPAEKKTETKSPPP